MKLSKRENLHIAVLALASVPIAIGFFGFLAWLGLDATKWFGAVLWTVGIFSVPLTTHRDDFRRMRCRIVFAAALALHVTVLTVILRGMAGFPNRFFLFFAFPEVGVLSTLLYFLGGAGRGRSRGRKTLGRELGPGSEAVTKSGQART